MRATWIAMVGVCSVLGIAKAQAPTAQPAAGTPPVSREARAIARLRVERTPGEAGSGAGVFVGEGLFLTSLQVIDEASRAWVVSACCGEFEVEGVVRIDDARDLALLRVKAPRDKIGVLSVVPAPADPGEKVSLAMVVQDAGVALMQISSLGVSEWPGYGPMMRVRMPLNPLLSTTPVLTGHDGVCAVAVVGGGNGTTLASVVPPEFIVEGETTPLQAFAGREVSDITLSRRALAHGIRHADAAEYILAAQDYRNAIALDPGAWRAHWLLGVALDMQGETADSIAPLTRAAELCPRFCEPPYSLGLVRLKLGHASEAVEHFDRAIELDPRYANAHGMRGAALFSMDRIDDAVAGVEKAIEIDPGDIAHVKNLTFMCQDNERRTRLPAAWRRYCKARPEDVAGWRFLAEQYDPETQTTEWLEAARQVARLEPKDPESHVRLGIGLLIARRYDEAERSFRRGLELDPEHPMATRALELVKEEREKARGAK